MVNMSHKLLSRAMPMRKNRHHLLCRGIADGYEQMFETIKTAKLKEVVRLVIEKTFKKVIR